MDEIIMISATQRVVITDSDVSYQFLDRGIWCYLLVKPKAPISIYPKDKH